MEGREDGWEEGYRRDLIFLKEKAGRLLRGSRMFQSSIISRRTNFSWKSNRIGLKWIIKLIEKRRGSIRFVRGPFTMRLNDQRRSEGREKDLPRKFWKVMY